MTPDKEPRGAVTAGSPRTAEHMDHILPPATLYLTGSCHVAAAVKSSSNTRSPEHPQLEIKQEK